jgi:hypothetical protein
MESINTMYNCIIDFYNCIKINFFLEKKTIFNILKIQNKLFESLF